MNRDLFNCLRAAADRVFAGTPICVAYAYGSRAHGTPHPESDMDIAYYAEAEEEESALQRFERTLAMEAALCRETGMDIDLRDLRHAPLELRGRVLVEGTRIYCGDRLKQVNLERETLARYLDYKDTFDRMHSARLNRMATRGL